MNAFFWQRLGDGRARLVRHGNLPEAHPFVIRCDLAVARLQAVHVERSDSGLVMRTSP
jgi:hypothetical protein